MKEDSLFTWKMFCVKRGFLFFVGNCVAVKQKTLCP